MEEALSLIRDGLSVRKAADQCNVPKSTLADNKGGNHKKRVGRPFGLSETEETVFKERILLMGTWGFPITKEETVFKERILLMGTWGFPITKQELRYLVKNYLDSRGRSVSIFKENKPGRDWVKGFLTRHKYVLTVRTANMLKRSRANVGCQEVQDFFARLTKTVEGVEAKNIYNYNVTNLRDDPGAKKAIFKRGIKYAEYVRDHNVKSCISLIVCGSSVGEFLPPRVVYRAQNLYESWTEGGPEGAAYSCFKVWMV